MNVALPQEPDEAAAARDRYVQELLRLYRETPGVAGRVRRADRELARALYDRNVPLYAVANAFIVAAARRIRHNAYSTPLPQIQSLHYYADSRLMPRTTRSLAVGSCHAGIGRAAGSESVGIIRGS